METCSRILKNGDQCQKKPFIDKEGTTYIYCKLHNAHDKGEVFQCSHICKNGNQCQYKADKTDGVYLTKCMKHNSEDEQKRLAAYRAGIPSGAALLDS
jgi:hypothetical protein